MEKQNEANGTASEPIARYDELPVLQTYKVALETMVQIGGVWIVGQDKNIYRVEMPNKIQETFWKNAKRYDIQTGKVVGYTNADRIRAMTDEELATFLFHAWNNASWCSAKDCPDEDSCLPCWIDWLKKECE